MLRSLWRHARPCAWMRSHVRKAGRSGSSSWWNGGVVAFAGIGAALYPNQETTPAAEDDSWAQDSRIDWSGDLWKQVEQADEKSTWQLPEHWTSACKGIRQGAASKNTRDRQKYVAEIQFYDDIMLFAGPSNPSLCVDIADRLKIPLSGMNVSKFVDGEIGVSVTDEVRGKDVYIIQSTCPPDVNDRLMELILMISTMKRASARKITAIIPYYGYARQDRKMKSRVPISAADVATLLQKMGVDRVVAVDLHCGQIQGFFGPRTPCDNLEGHVVALEYFANLGLSSESTKVVSPDAGGVYRATQFRDGLKEYGVDAGLAMIIKQRLRANQIKKMDLVGDVEGMDVIMVDDMIDTAGTLTKAANEIKKRGARRVFAFSTHGLFSGPAMERIEASALEQVVVLNTIPLDPEKTCDKIVQLSVADLLAEAIARIHMRKSVSALFGK